MTKSAKYVEPCKRGRGRPAGRSKVVVSLSLDMDLVTTLKATGPGWQTRVNDVLKAAVGLSGGT